MNNTARIFLLLACLFMYVYGESHFVCKQIEEIFTSNSATPSSPPHQRPRQGRKGAKGEKGENGDMGPKGNDGIVDYVSINATIKEYIKEIWDEFERTKGTEGVVVAETTTASPVIADCPIPYNNKCYFPKNDSKADDDQGKEVCAKMSGKLANIYSKEHFDHLVATIRSMFHHDHRVGQLPSITFRLGMTINPQTGETKLNDGTTAAPYLRWFRNYPGKSAKHTNVFLQVNESPTTTSQYLHNYFSTYYAYPLCEI